MKVFIVTRKATITWGEEYRADTMEEALTLAREEDANHFTKRFREDRIDLDDWESPKDKAAKDFLIGVFEL